jgi:L-alanine-DL-glutamate epimerase-like enolase superfamily enzyme
MRAHLRVPFGSAWGSVTERELVLLELEDDNGNLGLGEAAPLPGYEGVSIEDARRGIDHCGRLLVGSDGSDHDDLLARCAELTVVPHALAAIDEALWDLAGRGAGQAVWRLLGAAQAQPIEVNWTISAADRAGAAREAALARSAGYRCVKVKVGIGDDAGRLAAVRAAGGPEMAIRLDANGAWSVGEAAAALRALEPVGIELCEEPVHGLEAIEELSDLTRVRLAIDETSLLDGALERRVCTAVCLKVGRSGGIGATIAAARRAREVGYQVYLASALDGPVGIAAALHVAAAIRPERFCGLATLAMFAGAQDPLPVVDGAIALPAGPGLGDGFSRWYEAG